MRKKRIMLNAFLLLVLGLTELHAQENVNAAGGNHSGNGGSVAYSFGQIVYRANTDTDGSVTEGVQQPYEISTVTGMDEIEISISVSIFPNPAADFLTLQLDATTELNIQSMSYQLYDNSGKLLRNEKITGSQTSIIMSNLLPAVYFVKVMEGNKDVRTFKIIKN